MTRSQTGIFVFTGSVVIVLAIYYINRNDEFTNLIKYHLRSTEKAPLPNSLGCKPTPYDYRGADQEDPKLIEYIRNELLIPPSVHNYNLSNPKATHFSQFNQSRIANEFLKGMKGGFFVEVGAADGELLSNTLFFERELGWRGLLIEATPGFFKPLQEKNRNAYSISAALTLTPFASEVTFKAEMNFLGMLSNANNGIKVKGLPFFSILRALNVTVVDFLSLDIESYEVKVLKIFPWDKIKFRLMCVEVNHIPEGKEYLTKFLQGKGYKFLGYKMIDAWYAHTSLLN